MVFVLSETFYYLSYFLDLTSTVQFLLLFNNGISGKADLRCYNVLELIKDGRALLLYIRVEPFDFEHLILWSCSAM